MTHSTSKRFVALLALLSTFVVSIAAIGANAEAINKLIARTDAAQRSHLEARRQHTEQPDDKTLSRLQNAERILDRRSHELDRARAETLAEYSGLSVADIERVRINVLTWEATAREIGLHPSIIGIELIDARPPPFATARP